VNVRLSTGRIRPMTKFRDYLVGAYLALDGVEEPIECGWQDGGPVIPLHLLPPRMAYEGKLSMYIWRGPELVHSCVGQPVRFLPA